MHMSAIVFFSSTWQWCFCQCMLWAGIWWITITLSFSGGCFCTHQSEQWEFGLKQKKSIWMKRRSTVSGAKPYPDHSACWKSFQMVIGFQCLRWHYGTFLSFFLVNWYYLKTFSLNMKTHCKHFSNNLQVAKYYQSWKQYKKTRPKMQ